MESGRPLYLGFLTKSGLFLNFALSSWNIDEMSNYMELLLPKEFSCLTYLKKIKRNIKLIKYLKSEYFLLLLLYIIFIRFE